eukprot:scaffold16271_cov118-Skeletonema_dohrnii-CCMP3373.AAC.5
MASNRMARAACRFSRPMQQQNNSAVLSRPFCGTAAAPSPAWNKQVAVLPSPSSLVQQSSVESQLWRTALQDIKKKQQDEINNLQWLKDSLRAAQMMPPTTTVTTSPAQNTFQIMNRNARKPKRANHGKRPCSRVRRRWKTRSWANTSRRG